MARPIKNDILSGIQAWDAVVDDNDEALFNGPLPIHEHVGDQTDLAATFPAASYDRCHVMVDHTTLGWVRYVSDGASWILAERLTVTSVADATGTLANVVDQLNALLAALRNGDRIG